MRTASNISSQHFRLQVYGAYVIRLLLAGRSLNRTVCRYNFPLGSQCFWIMRRKYPSMEAIPVLVQVNWKATPWAEKSRSLLDGDKSLIPIYLELQRRAAKGCAATKLALCLQTCTNLCRLIFIFQRPCQQLPGNRTVLVRLR